MQKRVIKPASSAYLAYLFFGVAVGCILLLVYLPFYLPLKMTLLLLTLAYSLVVYKKLFYQNVSLILYPEGTWQITTPTDDTLATLCGDSTITRLVCVLRFSVPTHRHKQTYVIFCDALPPEDFKCLLTLKHYPH